MISNLKILNSGVVANSRLSKSYNPVTIRVSKYVLCNCLFPVSFLLSASAMSGGARHWLNFQATVRMWLNSDSARSPYA